MGKSIDQLLEDYDINEKDFYGASPSAQQEIAEKLQDASDAFESGGRPQQKPQAGEKWDPSMQSDYDAKLEALFDATNYHGIDTPFTESGESEQGQSQMGMLKQRTKEPYQQIQTQFTNPSGTTINNPKVPQFSGGDNITPLSTSEVQSSGNQDWYNEWAQNAKKNPPQLVFPSVQKQFAQPNREGKQSQRTGMGNRR